MRSAYKCMLLGLAQSAVFVFAVSLAVPHAQAQDVAETSDGVPEPDQPEHAGPAMHAGAAADGHAEEGEDLEGTVTASDAILGEVPTLPEAPRTWWFGAYLQGAFVPSFMLKLFLDEAPTVSNVGFGVTATHRTPGGMSLVVGLGYQSYAFSGPFRIAGDPDQDTEYLTSTLGFLHLRAQMLWSTDIVRNKFSFEYGVGLDVGLVLGQMRRSEAYRDAQGNFQPCAGPLMPDPVYCEEPQNVAAGTDAYNAKGAQYNVVEKRVPPVMLIPMLPVLALRYTPIPELAVKLNAAFGIMQFAVGLSAAYAPKL